MKGKNFLRCRPFGVRAISPDCEEGLRGSHQRQCLHLFVEAPDPRTWGENYLWDSLNITTSLPLGNTWALSDQRPEGSPPRIKSTGSGQQ